MKKNDSKEGRKQKVFYSGKNLPQWIFTELLLCIKNDMYPLQIANYLSKKYGRKYTKQHINYYLKILLKRKLIRKDHQKPVLTEGGKNALIHHENPKLYEGHALEVSYELKSLGDLPDNNVKLKNWGYWKDRFFDIFIKVHRGKRNKLVIYAPDVESNSKHDLLIKIGEKLGMILSLIERQYRCEIDWDTREITRRLEVHTPNDPEGKEFEKEKVNFRGKMIDINQSRDRHFDLKESKEFDPFESIERYDQMIRDFPTVKETMGKIRFDQTSILNLFAINTETMRAVKSLLLKRGGSLDTQTLKERLETPLNEAESRGTGSDSFFKQRGKDELVRIETLEVIPSFIANRKGILTEYPELNKNAKVYLPESVAMALIRKGRARKI